MRYFSSLLATATAVSALSAAVLPNAGQDVLASEDQYLIELEPGSTRWITEDEKWELKRVSD